MHQLIIFGIERAFELALSPTNGIVCAILSWLRQEKVEGDAEVSPVHLFTRDGRVNLIDTARLMGQHLMAHVMDELADFLLLHALECELEGQCNDFASESAELTDDDSRTGTPDLDTLARFGDEATLSLARRLISFERVFGLKKAFDRPEIPEDPALALSKVSYLSALS